VDSCYAFKGTPALNRLMVLFNNFMCTAQHQTNANTKFSSVYRLRYEARFISISCLQKGVFSAEFGFNLSTFYPGL